jgi:murein DD-endopeptidase MepM/ murein hydrolase activator NlpD
MAKVKYHFNPESLSFDRIKLSIKGLILKLLMYFFAGFAISIIFYFAFSQFLDFPNERMLKRENEQLKLQLDIFQKKLDQVSVVLDDLQQRDDNLYRTIFETEPIPRSVREAGFGGVNRYAELEGYENSDLIINTAKRLDKIMKQVYIQSKSYDELTRLAINKEEMLKRIPCVQPIFNQDLIRTSSGFGWRFHPFYKIKVFHPGFDFAAPVGTEVYATGDGTVEKVENNFHGYGNMIMIDHGYGYKTLYAHLSAFKVVPGQTIKRGQVIGFVGNTGLSTGPHLHYEVWKNGEKVNPVNYFFNDLSPEQFEQINKISSNIGQTLD